MNVSELVRARPRLIWPMTFRFAVAAWFGACAISVEMGARRAGVECREWLLLTLAVLVLPSLAIAIGLMCSSQLAAWFAVFGDCTIAAAGLGQVLRGLSPIAYGSLRDVTVLDGSVVAVGALFLAEGIYLLRKLGQPWSGVLLYMPVAALSFWLGWSLA